MRVIIMGCGRVGAVVAHSLWREGHSVTVMDTEPERFLLLPKEMREQEDTVFLGDGTLEEDLVRAGIEGADVFVAVATKDNRNALAAQKAKHVFKVPRVICRIGDPTRQAIYSQMDLVVISPTQVTADLILNAIQE